MTVTLDQQRIQDRVMVAPDGCWISLLYGDRYVKLSVDGKLIGGHRVRSLGFTG